jgi:hypothetical protein
MLSKQTLEHLLEAQSHLRAAIKCAATNEKENIIHQLSKILLDIENTKKFEELMDMLDDRKPGSSGSFGSFLSD